MPWRAVITRPVPRPATAGPAPPAAHLLFPPGREHQHPGGEPACSPLAGRIGRPSCGGAGRSVNCSGPDISAALDLPENQANPGIPQVESSPGDARRPRPAPDPARPSGTAPGTARRRCARHDRPASSAAATSRWARSSRLARPEAVARRSMYAAPTPASLLAGARPGQSLRLCRADPRDCASDPTRTLRTTMHVLVFMIFSLACAFCGWRTGGGHRCHCRAPPG
jgi:hypothetical protein